MHGRTVLKKSLGPVRKSRFQRAQPASSGKPPFIHQGGVENWVVLACQTLGCLMPMCHEPTSQKNSQVISDGIAGAGLTIDK